MHTDARSGRARTALVALLVTTVGLAGCLGGSDEGDDGAANQRLADGALDHAAIAAAIGTPIEIFHDHNDVLAHTGSFNLAQLGWTPLDVELGQNGFANFVFYEDDDEELAFVSIDGDTQGGFTIADISDPTNIETLGSYRVQGNGFQEVRVTPDGNYALMNVQDIPGAASAQDCPVCIHIVDVSDRSNPTLAGYQPVELIGTHNLHIEEYGSDVYVFYVGQPLSVGTPVGSNPPPGNEVNIARFVAAPTGGGGGAALVKVAEYRHVDAYTDQARSFPHDVLVQDHPDGRKIMYASWWDGGAITVDVTDPMAPQELDVVRDPAPSEALAIHWYMQEPEARADGRVIAWSAPEIGQLESGSGVIRGYDVTDPANVEQISAWELPGDVNITGGYIMSPHTTLPDMDKGLLAVSHYHAGVWLLDITDPADPKHVAYYLPHGDEADPYDGPLWWKKPNFDPEGYGPNVYQARWRGDLLWVTDRGTGLYALEYTGPVPGPLT